MVIQVTNDMARVRAVVVVRGQMLDVIQDGADGPDEREREKRRDDAEGA